MVNRYKVFTDPSPVTTGKAIFKIYRKGIFGMWFNTAHWFFNECNAEKKCTQLNNSVNG